jgi:hypothetical protein
MSVGLCWIPQYWNEGPYVRHLLHVMILSISLIFIVDETSGSSLYGRGPTGRYLCNIARYKPDLASHGIEDLGYDGVAQSVRVPDLFFPHSVDSRQQLLARRNFFITIKL